MSDGSKPTTRSQPKSHSNGRAAKRQSTTNGLEILDRITGDSPRLRDQVSQARVDMQVARLIYDARAEAGLTQSELAQAIGTNQSVISRLEDADYDGHSLSMLRRIAEALGKRLDIRFASKGHTAR